MRRVLIGAWTVAAALALTGCSQIEAIAPVGGDHQAQVRYAAIDVLVAAGTEILVAPVCESDTAGTITCAGETVSGEPIAVSSPFNDPTVVEVTVGDDVIYSGSIMAVIDDAAGAGS